jgi:AcrR family transcriptional regulator
LTSHPNNHQEPRKRPRQERSRQTFDRIVDVAARIFERDGYAATTTNDVAAEAGVSIGSLYQYFPNKDAILVVLAERHLDEVAERFAERADQLRRDGPPLDAVVAALVNLAVELHDTDRLHQLLAHQAPRTEHLQRRLDDTLAVIAAEVEHHLVRCEVGGIAPRRRALLLVNMVDAAVHEVVLRAPAGPQRRRAVRELGAMVTAAAAAEQVVAVGGPQAMP